MLFPVSYLLTAFLNDAIAKDQFRQQVAESSISATLVNIDVDFTNVVLEFTDPVNGSEKTTLDGLVAAHTATGRLTVGPVATLPDGLFADEDGYATDGRKVGEGGGAGTGVPIYWSTSEWRVFSTDAPVQA